MSYQRHHICTWCVLSLSNTASPLAGMTNQLAALQQLEKEDVDTKEQRTAKKGESISSEKQR